MGATGTDQQKLRVRLLFGEHVLSEHDAEPALARRYAASMERKFCGLRVAVEPIPPRSAAPAAPPLPPELLWPLTAQ